MLHFTWDYGVIIIVWSRVANVYHYYCNSSKDNEVILTSDQTSEHHEVTKLAATSDEYEEETMFAYAVVDTKKVRK